MSRLSCAGSMFGGAGIDGREQMADEPELAEGADGEWVTYLQQQLSSFGFYLGQIDGQFGPSTTEAVSALQQQYSIDESGTVGAATWDLLSQAGTADGQQDATWEQTYDDQAAPDGATADGSDAGVDKTPKAERFVNEEIDDPETEEAELPDLDADVEAETDETESVESA